MTTNNYKKCESCDGTGLTMVQTDEDECNQDICNDCGGTGKLPEPLKCPACGEQELRVVKIGNKNIPFENWEETEAYECDACGKEIKRCEHCQDLNEMEREYPDEPHHGAQLYCDECEADYYEGYEQDIVATNAQAQINHPELKTI